MNPILVTNTGSQTHETIINRSLNGADHFECIVAFAKLSGFKLVQKRLDKSLSSGMTARFIVGLDFFQTDPKLLEILLAYKGKWGSRIEIYISNSDPRETFHPKVYRFTRGKSDELLVGSANLTAGGLWSNHEVSLLYTGPASKSHPLDKFIEDALRGKEILKLTRPRLSLYEKQHALAALARRKFNVAQARIIEKGELSGIDVLREALSEMREISGRDSFVRQVRHRNQSYAKAARILDEFAGSGRINQSRFLDLYSQLASGLWHSGSLHRSKTKIARDVAGFRDLVRQAKAVVGPEEKAMEAVFTQAEAVNGAGVNVISEIMHTLDADQYAVMNQNSVAGLRMAGCINLPSKPTKQNTDGETYIGFCGAARSVQRKLGLRNLRELDAVCNYLYWQSGE